MIDKQTREFLDYLFKRLKIISCLFFAINVGLFSVTAFLKLASIKSVRPNDFEPLTNTAMQQWYLTTAFVEIFMVLGLLSPLRISDKLIVLRLFLSAVILYRLIAWVNNISYCSCLGQYRLSGLLQGHEGITLSGTAIGLFIFNELLIIEKLRGLK